MSRRALQPIFHLIIQSVKINWGVEFRELDVYKRERLEDYILQYFYELYRPIGKVPTVRYENSPECRAMEKIIEEKAKEEEMKEIIDRIIKGYSIERETKELKRELSFEYPQPTKKKREEVVIAGAV